MIPSPSSNITRRHALKGGLAAAAGGAVALGLRPSARAAEAGSALDLPDGGVVLFQGDSITDVGRDRGRAATPNDAGALGNGYPFLLGSALLWRYPKHGLKVYNRGISGNKVPDLAARWQADCIDLKPAVLSILIGVNDIWHKLNGNYDGTVEDYENGFAELLGRTRAALPDARLVICQPFVLRCGAVTDAWFPEFAERQAAAKRVADGAGALWVAFQDAFDAAVDGGTKPEYWAADGVHPTMAGHTLMADTWWDAVGMR